MAMKYFLEKFPLPETTPCIYTGLFTKPLSERKWSDRPNKCECGVSYTQFADAYDIDLGLGISLFDMIHGNCSYFADYYWYQNQDWTEVTLKRGDFWDNTIHTFCIKELNGKTLFADARGITDDPVVFFSDFDCGKNMHKEIISEKDRVDERWFNTTYAKAYNIIFGNPPVEVC